MKLKLLAFAVALMPTFLAMPTFGQAVTKIAAGQAHSLFLKSDGSLWAMGNNYFGALGDGTFNNTNRPEQIVAGGVTTVEGGWGYSLFLKSDGSLWVMGYNNYGQLGDGTFNNTNRPEQIVAGGVTAISVGAGQVVHSLFLKSDDSLWAMGDDESGQLGDGQPNWAANRPEQIVAGGVTAIAAGGGQDGHSLFLKSDGSLWAMGNNGYGQLGDGTFNSTNRPERILAGGVTAIAAARHYSLFLKSDGSLWAMGQNWGQFGDGRSFPTYDTNRPEEILVGGVTAIAAGYYHSLFLKSDGSLWAMGDNQSGQLGDGTFNQKNTPEQIVTSGVMAIAAGDWHSLFLKSDGSLWAMGYNPDGELGDGTFNNKNRPEQIVAPIQSLPIIITQPQSQTAQVGSNVAFSVVAGGYPPPNYQWLFNGQNIAGQTAASLCLANVEFANAGGYSVIVTNAYGSVTSAVAQLTVFTNLVVVQTNRTPTTNEIGQPTIPTSNYLKVFTNGTFKSGITLDRNKMTVVLTHGFNGSPSDWAAYTAQIIQQRIGVNAVNIVAWDWTSDAQGQLSELGKIAAKTPREGNALGTNLVAALGANYTKRIHFIGHSLGTLVNAAAANYIHTNGFSWTNTQMTLCDEAEVAWTFTSAGWQMATTLPEIIGQAGATLETFDGNFSTPQPGWAHPLPNQFAWADNYVSAFGLLHSGAANVILTQNFPASLPDISAVVQEFYNFHDYAHFFYEDTIEPGLFNTGGQTNATYAGFVCSFEGGGYAGRPATNTYFYQDPNGLELSLVQINLAFATNLLNARFKIYQLIGISWGVSQGENEVFGPVAQALGQVNGQIVSAGQNLENMVLNLFTSAGSGSLVQSSGAHPLGGPVPNGLGSGNTPAYAWLPLNVPSNALSMSFDFMLQGNGNNDSFQVALNGTNVMSLETSLIQTNVTLNSGMIDVSQYAGRQVTLFMGIFGGTSTNAALTASGFQFYVALPPSLQIQLAGTNVVLTWPFSAAGYVLQSANKLAPPTVWTTVTNVPGVVNFQYTVTNQISGGSRFYRLAEISTVAPALQAQISGSSFVLSWPASTQNFSLQTTTNLTDANSWTTVTNVPALLNQQNVVTNGVSGRMRFYRLKMQ